MENKEFIRGFQNSDPNSGAYQTVFTLAASPWDPTNAGWYGAPNVLCETSNQQYVPGYLLTPEHVPIGAQGLGLSPGAYPPPVSVFVPPYYLTAPPPVYAGVQPPGPLWTNTGAVSSGPPMSVPMTNGFPPPVFHDASASATVYSPPAMLTSRPTHPSHFVPGAPGIPENPIPWSTQSFYEPGPSTTGPYPIPPLMPQALRAQEWLSGASVAMSSTISHGFQLTNGGETAMVAFGSSRPPSNFGASATPRQQIMHLGYADTESKGLFKSSFGSNIGLGRPSSPQVNRVGKGASRNLNRKPQQAAPQIAVWDQERPICAFCRKNGEEDYFHLLKNSKGEVVCPVLSRHICKLCGRTGRRGHTIKFCKMNCFTKGDPVAAGFSPGLSPPHLNPLLLF